MTTRKTAVSPSASARLVSAEAKIVSETAVKTIVWPVAVARNRWRSATVRPAAASASSSASTSAV